MSTATHSQQVLAEEFSRRPGWRTRGSLSQWVAVLTGLAVAIAVGATGAFGLLATRDALAQQVDAGLLKIARDTVTQVGDDPERLMILTDVGRSIGGSVTVTLIRPDLSFAAPSVQPVVITPDETDLDVARGTVPKATRTVSIDAGQYRVVTVPAEKAGYAIMVGRPLLGAQTILANLTRQLVVFGLIAVVLAGLVGAAVAHVSLRSVRLLIGAVEDITDTNELRPVLVKGRGELSRLASAFNKMIVSLAGSRQRQARMVADAGHELRTPLTSMRTNVELLTLDHQAAMLPPAERLSMLRDVNAQLAELSGLIGDLVQLSREDQPEMTFDVVDLRAVIETSLSRVRRRAGGLAFDVELHPHFVLGEAATLERAITNLLDNAVKFSPTGGTVWVRLEGDRLRVADEGPGVPEDDLPHVFDRFFRSEKARATPGTGLGLSIVAQAAARHGGWARASRSTHGGAEFTLRLPGAGRPDDLLEEQLP